VEKNKIIWAIKAAKSDNITVLPIVGFIGVGKTTLAKLVYHDPHVEREFERIWVWVSNIFDEVRVTREILDVVTMASHEGSRNRESYEGVSNYSKLLEVLKKHMACLSKKFLLVLDDVNDCMDASRWKDPLDALGSGCTKGNVIIVGIYMGLAQ
jgi:Cdc6-like AAA superfamily ATPase